MPTSAPSVFISYSHKDGVWKDRLVEHLQVLRSRGDLAILDDRRIQPGEDWRNRLEEMYESAHTALLLISADYLASEYIQQQELPRLLERQARGELRIIPILVRACNWQDVPWLAQIQILPRTAQPLSSFRGTRREEELVRIAEEVLEAVQSSRSDTLTRLKVSLNGLPVYKEPLFGRERELKFLDDAWENPRVHVVSLVGPGGVGKSALVGHWLGRLEQDQYRGAERVFGWPFYSQPSVKDFFDAWRRFGLPDYFHRIGARPGQRILLVLDGLEVLQEPSGPNSGRLKDSALSTFLHELATSNPGLVVLTSRMKMPDLQDLETAAPVLRIEGLAPEAGVSLLRSLGAQGSQAELAAVVQNLEGHSLGLTLLAAHLASTSDGDIRKWNEALQSENPVIRRLVQSYEAWLGAGPEISALRMMTLFEGDASPDELSALRAKPPIPGLTDQLQDLSSSQWAELVARLQVMGLLIPGQRSGALRVHPLFRNLPLRNPEAIWQGHERLFRYLQGSVRKPPETTEEMAPLISAIAHGCAADLHQDALEIYRERISREQEHYLTRTLGEPGLDLRILSSFFHTPWTVPVSDLPHTDRLFLLQEAGTDLLVLGRAREAIDPFTTALQEASDISAWEDAARAAVGLGAAQMLLGRLAPALESAEQAIKTSGRSRSEAVRELAGRLQTVVLFHTGKIGQAEGDAGLGETPGSREALQTLLVWDLAMEPADPAALLPVAEAALERARRAGARPAMALASSVLGSLHLRTDPAKAQRNLDESIDLLRRMEARGWLAQALLLRSAARLAQGRPSEALADAEEALQLAVDGEWRLRETEARLALSHALSAAGRSAEARRALDAVRGLIKESGARRLERAVQQQEEQSSAPEPTAEELLSLAFRLVLEGQARAETLTSFEPERILQKARSLVGDEVEDPVLAARELLEKQQQGVEPNPLWLSWMTVTQGHAVQALKKRP